MVFMVLELVSFIIFYLIMKIYFRFKENFPGNFKNINLLCL